MMACTVSSNNLGTLTGLTIKAQSSGNSIYYYGGIPYALPPIGQWRFRRPRSLPSDFRYNGNFTGKCGVCPQPEWMGNRQESSWDEDCLKLNIYIPAGEPPVGGWPVFFYIHGGFLQWGSPNMTPEAIAPLLTETAFRCIIVQPAYRLNAFGFLASQELHDEAQTSHHASGNMGFWDQRMALEWTSEHIKAFGGNPGNITVGGYSAGAHSTFQQLAHELYFVPREKAVIRRVIMWSNSPGIQPKGLDEQQKQFDELISALGIPSSLNAKDKLSRLRGIPARDIIDIQSRMKTTEFRATTDDSFVSMDSIAHINSGDFARRMKSRGIKLMNGECRDEHSLYRAWRTPSDTYDSVYTRLCADYPERAVQRLMRHYCGRSKDLPKNYSSWRDLFGYAYASIQVYFLERGFHERLATQLQPGKDLLRYKIEWLAGCNGLPPEWGVTHSTDMAIWFWHPGLTAEEKRILKPWNEAFSQYVKGEDVTWGTEKVTDMRRLRSDGRTDIIKGDDKWHEALHVWKLLSEDKAQARL